MNVTNEDTIKAYDGDVKAYYNLSPQKVSSHVKSWLDEALRDFPKTASLFEVGSGTGKDANYIESLGYKITMSDASMAFVEFLKKNNKSAWHFNVIKDEFDDKYDLIIADAVLLHFTESELMKVLNKLNAALKKSGRLAFTVKRVDGDFTEKEKLGNVRYFHLWQPDDLKIMLNAAGFVVTYEEIAEDTRGEFKPAWILMVAENRGIVRQFK